MEYHQLRILTTFNTSIISPFISEINIFDNKNTPLGCLILLCLFYSDFPSVNLHPACTVYVRFLWPFFFGLYFKRFILCALCCKELYTPTNTHLAGAPSAPPSLSGRQCRVYLPCETFERSNPSITTTPASNRILWTGVPNLYGAIDR